MGIEVNGMSEVVELEEEDVESFRNLGQLCVDFFV